MLSRNTEWRQGGVLTHDSACNLGLLIKDATDKCVIVITHDCDLRCEKEEYVEVIVAERIFKVDSSLTAARHVRRLHLSYMNESTLKFVELQHSARRFIPKGDFFASAKQNSELILSSEEKRTLKQWLAARYGRPAFPNEFENRLNTSKKFEEKLTSILKQADHYLIGIFFDLGEERSNELPIGSPYFLRISLVYESVQGPTARIAMEDYASSIKTLFHNFFGSPETASEIVLESCQAVADTLFSIADARKVDQWSRFDYISLRETPTSPLLALGTTSI